MFRKYIALFVLCFFMANLSMAQNSKRFQKKMNFWLSWYHIPGCQIVFVKDGKISKTFNFKSSIYKSDQKIKTETLFQVGKVNQIYTALALMKEISEGKINGSKDINKQITSYKLRNSILNQHKKTTPFQLLDHSGGINRSNFDLLESDISFSTLDLLKGSKITKRKKIHNFQTPLKSYLYSEGAFTIARLLIEEKSELDYLDYIKKYVEPALSLPLVFNGFEVSDRKKAFSHEYSKWATDMPNLFPNYEGYGSWMSAKSYAELLVKILDDNQVSSRIGIKSKVYNRFTTPVIKIKDSQYSSCAVFEKHDFEKGVYRLVDKRNGFRSWAYYDTESKEGVVILINSEFDYFFRKYENKVIKKIKKFSSKYDFLQKLSPFLE